GEKCPKKVVNKPVVNDTNANNDGFQQVVNKKRNNKRSLAGNKLPKGVPVAKGFQVGKDFQYQPRAPSDGSNGGGNRGKASSKVGSSKDANVGASVTTKGNSSDRQQDKDVVDTGMMKMSNITMPNPFAALGGDEEEEEEEEVENVWDESVNLNIPNTGASTPAYKKWISNGSICSKGSRIILGWNDDIVDVMIMAQTNQVMHVQINIRADNKALFCSFIYSDNYYVDRRALWNNLTAYASDNYYVYRVLSRFFTPHLTSSLKPKPWSIVWRGGHASRFCEAFARPLRAF
ncbi:hypothetical protein Tco_1007114, partial [Tanacetum coccineum]